MSIEQAFVIGSQEFVRWAEQDVRDAKETLRDLSERLDAIKENLRKRIALSLTSSDPKEREVAGE